jgi:hypothetical protein
MGAERALNTIEAELKYRLERMKEQVVVKLVDGSTNTSSGVDVDGKKRRLLALGISGNATRRSSKINQRENAVARASAAADWLG